MKRLHTQNNGFLRSALLTGGIAVLGASSFWAADESGHVHRHTSDDQRVFELEGVEVVSTATRSERLATEVAIRTEVLSSELFFSSGTRDLSTAIEYLPGARTESNCQNCGTTELKLLGLGSGYNQILLDGQPLFSGLAAVYGLEQIPTTFVDRIEVVKGGASSLYGPGAVAGVVNIIPAEPVATRIQGETSFESFKGEPAWNASVVADYAAAGDRFAASAYGQWNQSEAVDLNADGFSDITEKDFYTTGVNTWAYPTEHGRLSVNYGYTWEYRRGGDRFDLLPHETQITEELEHVWHRGGIRWESALSEDFNYELAASVSDISRHSYYGGVGEVALPGAASFDQTAYEEAIEGSRKLYGYTESRREYLDALFHHDWDAHYVSWGLQYQQDDVFDEKRDDAGRSLRSDGSVASTVGEDPVAQDTYDLFGILVQDEWSPSARWTVIGGTRFDKHSALEDWSVSPRMAVRYTPDQNWVLRGSVASGFRAPEIFDEDFHIEILDDPTRTRNAPGLKEERSLSTAAGFIWTPAFARKKLQADVELFRTEIRDAFFVSDVVVEDPEGNAFKYRRNSGGAAIQGIEANTLYRFSERFKGEIGFSYVDGRFDQPQEVLPGVFEDRFIESPELTGVAQLSYENEKFVDVFLGAVYTGPMIAIEEVAERVNRQTQEFWVVDLTVAKHFEVGQEGMHIDLMAGVRNLFDERQEDLSSGASRDTTYFYGPRYPRSYVVKARVHF